MSAHPQEQLSAYLDDELTAAERSAVEAHVAGCSECRDRLASLAIVDEAARELPLRVRDDYFDAFATRVRQRIEAASATSTPARGRRLPGWSWAVAAALLLAVVTPLTLRERAAAPGRAMPEVTDRAAPIDRVSAPPGAPAPGSSVPQPRSTVSPHGGAPSQATDRPARTDGGPQQVSPPRPPAAEQLPHRNARPADGAAESPQLSFSAPPGEEDSYSVGGGRPDASPEESPAVELKDAAATADASSRDAAARRATVAAEPASTPPLPKVVSLGGAVTAPAGAAAKGEVETQAASTAAASQARRRGDLDEAEPDFSRLDASRPAGVDGWRALREAWRAFAAAHPGSPRADEARVRTIAAGLELVRRHAGAADEATFRRDAREYLSRADAAQKPRVSALVDAAAATR